MRWADEDFVRVQRQDNRAWKALPWQGKALFPLLLRKVNGDGFADTLDDAAGDVAALTDLPREVVVVGLLALVREGMVTRAPGGLSIPNFVRDHADDTMARFARLRRYARRLLGPSGGPCAYCGAMGEMTVDHVVPLTRGGGNDPENLAHACASCNASKGDRTPDEWVRP